MPAPTPTNAQPTPATPPTPPDPPTPVTQPTPQLGRSGPSRPVLEVLAWPDPVIDALGHDPRSPYVERFWLPHLGPTAAWFVRSLAVRFDAEPDGFSVDVADAAKTVGIGASPGQNGPLAKTLDRLARFGLAQRLAEHRVSIRRRLPPLTQYQANRLPRRLRGAHTRWLDEQRARQDHPGFGGHAARLARSLLDLGATDGEVLAQLERWHFRGEAASRALRSAHDAHPSLGP